MTRARTVRRALLGVGLLVGARAALEVVPLQRADVRAGDALRSFGAPGLDRAVISSTDLGSLYAVGGCTAALVAAGERDAAADVAAVGLVAWVVSQRAKTRVRRARPYEAHGTRRLLRPPTGSSFPSGHATVATAVGALLGDRAGSTSAGRALRAVGPYVAMTRVYAGVHYPTDVVGGAGLGLVLAACWQGVLARRGRGVMRRGWVVTHAALRVLTGVRARGGGSSRPGSGPSPRGGRRSPRAGAPPARRGC